MLQLKAAFNYKDTELHTKDCVVDKVIRLSGFEYDRFSRSLSRDWDFIRDNPIDTVIDKEGRYHCLLVVGEDRRDGILVNAEGGSYARYSAFIPNVEGLLTIEQYPALVSLNKRLTDIVDYIAAQSGERAVVDFLDLETVYGIDLMTNGVLRDAVLDMLGERSEIKDFELDKNELIVYPAPEPPVEDFSDPTVTKTDMFAYGYGWDGMIPLGKDRARELFDIGHTIYRLYQNDAEGMIDCRDEIRGFDGLFGTEDPAWEKELQKDSFEVFILNREKYDKGEADGKWLTLPADAGTLYDLLLHIGIETPSDGAFTKEPDEQGRRVLESCDASTHDSSAGFAERNFRITAIRVPEIIRDYVSKYDNLDELNMLASFLGDMEDFEYDKFQAILTSGVKHIGNGTADLINMLYANNFDAFELIDAKDAESLARYYHAENNEKPDNVSFKQYGEECIKDEGGVFTESGYIKFKHKELTPEYTGVVPNEYKITGMALQAFRLNRSERGLPEEKPSVIKQIRDAQKAFKAPHKGKSPDKKKGEPEL